MHLEEMSEVNNTDECTENSLRQVKGFVFDMDGTLVLGDKKNNALNPLPGAIRLLAWLKENSIPYVVFTNGTTRSPAHYAETLRASGLDVSEATMMTPASSAADLFVRRKYKKVMVMGGDGLTQPLIDVGIEVVWPGDDVDVDAILVGWYPEFSMKTIELACEAIWNGAKLYSSSDAIFFASSKGRALGTSRAIAAMLSSITGCRSELVGKPSLHAVSNAARRLGVRAKDIAVVGDDPCLEVPMGIRAKGCAIAVNSGLGDENSYIDFPANKKPYLHISDVDELLKLIQKGHVNGCIYL